MKKHHQDSIAFVIACSIVLSLVFSCAPAHGYEGFSDNYANHTTTQLSSGLMWTSNTSSTLINFAAAEAFCESSSQGGFTDWRIPSALEYRGLEDDTINPTLPPSLDYDYRGFWAKYGKIVQFTSTGVAVAQTPSQASLRYVHCVRDANVSPVYLTVTTQGNEWKVTANSGMTTEVYVNDVLAASFTEGTTSLGFLNVGDTIHVVVGGAEAETVEPVEYGGLPAWSLWFVNNTVQVDVYDPAPEDNKCEFDSFAVDEAYVNGYNAAMDTIGTDPCSEPANKQVENYCRQIAHFMDLINNNLNK